MVAKLGGTGVYVAFRDFVEARRHPELVAMLTATKINHRHGPIRRLADEAQEKDQAG